ncbi:MAG TPA: ferritin-like domain-containing protein [Thermoanaerobaculia bacterium]|nr:ferritin-like domain-containing protein [Thermoanaerobaculia bacterium]
MTENATSAGSQRPDLHLLREVLIRLLHDAAEIEQQLMIQYLYAAFSLKKYPDRTCSEAQYESVRRWGSALLAVARSEMEHLALVNGILSAIGADPFFDRQNIPAQFPHFLGKNLEIGREQSSGNDPCDVPFLFERFNLPTIQRFVCAESPSLEVLLDSRPPLPVPKWCFSCSDGESHEGSERRLRSRPPLFAPLAASHVPDELWQKAEQELAKVPGRMKLGAAESVRPGTIQEVYKRIDLLLEFLSSRMDLFTGQASNQVFVVVEYQVNIFPIVDLATALSATRQIVEEGEGIDSPPDYKSHFLRFFGIHDELVALLAEDPRFEPSMPVLFNPKPEDITNEFARQVFEVFNDAYATLVLMLTALYKTYQPQASQSYPYFSAALQESAFGPMMTMILRPLAEVLAYSASGDGEHTTGPNYFLSDKDRELLRDPGSKELNDINFFLRRFDRITARLAELGEGWDDERLAAAAREPEDGPFLRRQLRFASESATALTNNLRRIYQSGQLPEFVVNP